MLKVLKFGGSSVSNSTQFQKVKKIVEADEFRRFIVTSACGKEDKEDHKVTDLLYLTHAHIKYGVEYDSIFSLVEKKYISIRNDLKIDFDIEKEFLEIRSKLKKSMSVDFLVSRGEYLAAKMLAKYLNAEFVDATEFIRFNYDGSINLEKTEKKFNECIDKTKKYVFPGFYGEMPDGEIMCMSRGGSDITGSIIANILNADIYENWTDVSGILVADPRIVKDPKPIPLVSYEEIRLLSYMGANVLHEEAMFPAKAKNIPINIRNTNDMDNSGTIIKSDCKTDDEKNPPNVITSITGRKDHIGLAIKKSTYSREGSLRKSLKVLEEFKIKYEVVTAGVDSLTIVVSKDAIEKYIYEIISRIKKETECDSINVIKDVALVAVVGRGMVNKKGMSGELFGTLGKNGINIMIISQGSDELSIIVGIDNNDFEKAINCIYNSFIK